MKTAIEWLLFESGNSVAKIANETGIRPTVIRKYTKEGADIDNMSLKNAMKLHKYFEEMIRISEQLFGSVKFEGKEYILTGEAQLNHLQGLDGVDENHYNAPAVDDDGNEYMVFWNTVEGYEEMEDETECCDWNNPASVGRL